MKASSFFGHKCPNCGSTTDVAGVVGSDQLHCPSCGTIMEPDPEGKAVAANVYCPNCESSFGLVTSDKCPQCGGPFSRLK